MRFSLLFAVGGVLLPSLRAADDVKQFPHGSFVFQVEVSPDGKLVLTDDKVWDVATGKVACELPLPTVKERPYRSWRVAFAPDSKSVALHRYNDLALVSIA